MVSFPQSAALPRRIFPRVLHEQGWKTFILLSLVAWLYVPVLLRLVEQWWSDPNFSHGFFVPAFSLFLVWRDRARLLSLEPRPSPWGLPVLMAAMSLLAVGILGAEIFLPRASLLVLIAGLVIFFLGWEHFRALLLPWLFLILMIPIPVILFEQITFPLQLLASKGAAALLPLANVPVLREGNVIHLPRISLEVAQACSGIRSLLSLVTLTIIYGHFAESRRAIRIVLGLASVPIAVAANSMRIVGTGLLAQYWDPSRAEGFLHVFSGWLMFMISLAALALLHQLLRIAYRKMEKPGT